MPMSKLRGIAFFEWHGKNGYLAAKNCETDPLTHRISDRQMRLFLTLLAQTERAIAAPETSVRLGPWMAGYLAGWTSSLLAVNCDQAGHLEETGAVKTGRCSQSGDNAGSVRGGHQGSSVRSPSSSSSGCADGESAGELPTPSRTDDALPLKHAASMDVFDAHIARRFEVKS